MSYLFSQGNTQLKIGAGYQMQEILPQAKWEVFSVTLRQRALQIAGIRKKNCGLNWLQVRMGLDKIGALFKPTYRGAPMSLATIAYRVSSDPSFASSLQQSPDDVLQSTGIVLTEEERTALQKILSVPGMINDLLDHILKAEPWVYCA